MQQEGLLLKDNICFACREPIKAMAFKGTGACGEQHRKILAGEGNNA